jgi:hypothetical protein
MEELMIIKLTNAAKDFEGKTLLLNTKHILSVFEDVKVLDDKTIESITSIYTTTKESWSVKESIDTIYEMINPTSSYISHDLNDITMPDPYTGLDMTDEVIDPIIHNEGEAL